MSLNWNRLKNMDKDAAIKKQEDLEKWEASVSGVRTLRKRKTESWREAFLWMEKVRKRKPNIANNGE